MSSTQPAPVSGAEAQPTAGHPRFQWLDGAKGLAILWIVFFHFFSTYTNSELPSPTKPHFFADFFARCANPPPMSSLACSVESVFTGLSYLGFHAVAVFIVASGFGLTYSASRPGGPPGGWPGWFRARVIRLFPMYWTAHLIFLVSPFEFHPEPIDYRFVLSFLGDRVYPLDRIFYYANSAWWYFGLILELYLVFPLLFWLLRKAGVRWFLVICAVETIASRLTIISLPISSGPLLQGAFFGCRLWEFAFGMVVGIELREHPDRIQRLILGALPMLGGLAIYTAGLYSYGSNIGYSVTDALTGTGMFILLSNIALASERVSSAGAALARVGAFCYGLYLLHQPYVTWLGIRMRWMTMPEFVAASVPIIIAITVASMGIERTVDQITDSVLHPHPAVAHPATAD
jgi:peptidoglycan/LPS O-acetylase OafA/YrhL